MNGFINLLKPPGMSSAQAVGAVKRIIGIKKVGHAGTLDPLASGVMPIMIGRACKLFDSLQNHQKEYIFEIAFGKETDTLDAEGNVISSSSCIPDAAQIQACIPKFLGKIQQAPPMFSAIKREGKPLYELARKGQNLDIPLRETEVYALSLLQETQTGRHLMYVKCKSGFYVRSLCRDLAIALGSRAYMSLLIRQSVANFCLKDAISLEELQQKVTQNHWDFLIPMDFPLQNIPSIHVSTKDRWDLCNGKELKISQLDGVYKVYEGDCFLGLARNKNKILKMQTLLEV